MTKAESRLSLAGAGAGCLIGLGIKYFKKYPSNKVIFVSILIGSVVGFGAGMALDKMLSKLQ